MSMGEYYEDMVEQADRDNEIDRLERLEQVRDLDERIKKLILQQMDIIKSESIAARDKKWVYFLHSKCPHKKIGEKRSCNACMYLFEKEHGL